MVIITTKLTTLFLYFESAQVNTVQYEKAAGILLCLPPSVFCIWL